MIIVISCVVHVIMSLFVALVALENSDRGVWFVICCENSRNTVRLMYSLLLLSRKLECV
jgi:hypothetical protein